MVAARFSDDELDEMRDAVEASDVPFIRVKRDILLKLLAPLKLVKLLPAATSRDNAIGTPKIPHKNARVAEFEEQHPDWLMREVMADHEVFNKRKTRIGIANVRYVRIIASPGFVRYYCENSTFMRELMKMLGHDH